MQIWYEILIDKYAGESNARDIIIIIIIIIVVEGLR